jgi:hypothetical protein
MTSRKKPQKKRSMVPFYVGGGILALLLVAFITTGLGESNADDGNSNAQEYADVSITGGPLPPYSQDTADTSIGMTLPEVSGESFDGTPVSITNDGRPKVVLLLTHW